MASENQNIDFFSTLPDPLLHTILSFLPFNEAATTSILSRRWRHTWRSTATVDFNELLFSPPKRHCRNPRTQRRAFVDFTSSFVNTYEPNSLNEFKLTFSKPDYFQNDVVELITFAASRNPKLLSIDLTDPSWPRHDPSIHEPELQLPDDVVFTNLESLTLYYCSFLAPQLAGSGSLARLKELSLGWMRLDSSSLTLLLSSNPMLEVLCLKTFWNMDGVDISVPTSCSRLETVVVDGYTSFLHRFRLAVPGLKMVKYSGPIYCFELGVTDCLEAVDLDFGFELALREYTFHEYNDRGQAVPENDIREDTRIISALLLQISHVKVLTVCGHLLMAHDYGVVTPMNVRHLMVKAQMHKYEFYGMIYLLHRCPSLERLEVEITVPDHTFKEYWPDDDFYQFNNLICIRESLRVVEMNGYRGGSIELFLLKRVIELGSVMERVRIRVSGGPGFNTDAILHHAQLQLLQLNRASQHLDIIIS